MNHSEFDHLVGIQNRVVELRQAVAHIARCVKEICGDQLGAEEARAHEAVVTAVAAVLELEEDVTIARAFARDTAQANGGEVAQ